MRGISQALFLKVNLNIVVPSILKYSKYAHPFRFPTKVCTHLSFSHVCYIYHSPMPVTFIILPCLLHLSFSHACYIYHSPMPATFIILPCLLHLSFFHACYIYHSPMPATFIILPCLLHSSFSHACYIYHSPMPATCPSIPSWFDDTNIWWRDCKLQIMRLLNTQFPQSFFEVEHPVVFPLIIMQWVTQLSVYVSYFIFSAFSDLFSLWSKYPPQHPMFKHFNLCCSLNTRN